MCSDCLFERGELAISSFFRAVNSGESNREVNTCRIEGVPCPDVFAVNFRKERGSLGENEDQLAVYAGLCWLR